jgi:hypothetical protein
MLLNRVSEFNQAIRAGITTIGPLFLLNAVAALLIAAALLWKPRTIVVLLGFGFSVATFGGFMLASTRGLFGFVTIWTTPAAAAFMG